ncbi:MAG TPA: ABC transporter substrate-binding protein [Planctomycetota bacterium]|nr:ABC transporter substrate-binding protein [Planctomycetota bacterium]
MRLLAVLLAIAPLFVPQERAVIVYARGDQTDTIDPQATDWGGSAKVLVNIYESLVTFSEDGSDIVPGLAEKWDRSADGKTWTFHLRKGVTFHDGTEFNAAAVAFTLERLLGRGAHVPKSVPYGPQYGDIDTVETPDAHTVVIKLKAPSAVFLMNLAMFPAGIVSPDAVKKHGAQFGRNPVGTGPLKFKQWDPAVRIVLDRNDDYWGAKAKMSRLIILDVKDPQVAIQKLKKGEVQVVDHITLADIPGIEADSNLRMEYEVSMNVCYLGFNMRKAPYNDPNFRRAVAHAIDRNKIIKIAYQDRAEAAKTLVPPSIFAAPKDLPSYGYDPEKAKEYLAKANLPAGFEAAIWHMTYPRPYVPEPDKLVQVIQDDLSRIGLKVRLEGFNVDIYTKKLRDLEHPMFLLGWSADIADPDNFLYALLHGESIGPLDRPSGTNHAFFNHPRFNEVVKAAQTEVDADKRRGEYEEALKIYQAEVPTLPLAHVKQMAAAQKNVKYNHHPIEYRFWNIERSK